MLDKMSDTLNSAETCRFKKIEQYAKTGVFFGNLEVSTVARNVNFAVDLEKCVFGCKIGYDTAENELSKK